MERALVVSGGRGAPRDRGRRRRPVAPSRPEDPVSLADVLEPLARRSGRASPARSAARRWVAANRTLAAERRAVPSPLRAARRRMTGRHRLGGATSADRLRHVLDRPVRFAYPTDGRVGGRARLRRRGLRPLGTGPAARVGGRGYRIVRVAGDRPSWRSRARAGAGADGSPRSDGTRRPTSPRRTGQPEPRRPEQGGVPEPPPGATRPGRSRPAGPPGNSLRAPPAAARAALGRWRRRIVLFPIRPAGWAVAVDDIAEPADVWHGMWAPSLPALERLRRRHGGRTVYDSRDLYIDARTLAGWPPRGAG